MKKWGKNAETAVTEGKDDLAGKALERQMGLETELASTKASLKSMTLTFDQMKDRMFAQKKKIETYATKMSSLKARQKSAQSNLKMRETLSKYEGSDSAFDQISRYEDKVEDLINKSTAADEIDVEENGTDLDAEFADMNASSSSNDRLAALKAKMGK